MHARTCWALRGGVACMHRQPHHALTLCLAAPRLLVGYPQPTLENLSEVVYEYVKMDLLPASDLVLPAMKARKLEEAAAEGATTGGAVESGGGEAAAASSSAATGTGAGAGAGAGAGSA